MRLKHIDALRGIAALMVTFFHLSGNSVLSQQTSSVGKYGYLGVEIFFVISGFVLPYSLLKSGYRLKNFFPFIVKRIVRIHPAYITVIIISMALAALTGREPLSLPRFVWHLVFLNAEFGYPDVAPVFWTLKIEFAFYILISLSFTTFFTSNYKSIVLIAAVTVSSLFNIIGVFHWLLFFALGILIFNKWFTNMSPYIFWPAICTLLLTNIKIHGVAEAMAGCFGCLFILFARIEHFPKAIGQILLWLGMISYSLYLIHWELGRAAVIFARHIPAIGSYETLRLVLGLGFSLICAYLLYKYVEKSSIAVANKIKYKS
jgi:peptidoglycan/LPS O-acetylase OafA/YrhL